MTPVHLALALCCWSIAASISAADAPCRTGKGSVAAEATCRSVALIQSKTSSEQKSGDWLEDKEEHEVGAEKGSAHGLPLTLPEMAVFVRDKAASLTVGEVAPEEVSEMVSLMRDFLQKMVNETHAGHSKDQLALDDSLYLLEACGPDLSPLKTAAQTKREAHAACRVIERENAETELAACREYHAKRKGEFANPPSCAKDQLSKVSSDVPQELEEFEACMKELSKWFQVHEFGQACRYAEETHKSRTSECGDIQEDFEDSVCDQAREQQVFCKCHDRNLAFYEQLVKDVETREANRQVDYRTAQRIDCYLDVMEQHNASKAVVASRTSSLADCNEMNVSDENLTISYGNTSFVTRVGEEKSCETIGKPCEESWAKTEYESGSWDQSAAPAAACTPCPAPPTQAPPTPEPTPAPVPPGIGDWTVNLPGNGWAGIVSVYSRGISRTSISTFTVQWPLIKLDGTNKDGIYALHAAGHAPTTCTAICKALGAEKEQSWHEPGSSRYPSGVKEVAAAKCLWTNDAGSGVKTDWHFYQASDNCGYSMSRCRCRGSLTTTTTTQPPTPDPSTRVEYNSVITQEDWSAWVAAVGIDGAATECSDDWPKYLDLNGVKGPSSALWTLKYFLKWKGYSGDVDLITLECTTQLETAAGDMRGRVAFWRAEHEGLRCDTDGGKVGTTKFSVKDCPGAPLANRMMELSRQAISDGDLAVNYFNGEAAPDKVKFEDGQMLANGEAGNGMAWGFSKQGLSKTGMNLNGEWTIHIDWNFPTQSPTHGFQWGYCISLGATQSPRMMWNVYYYFDISGFRSGSDGGPFLSDVTHVVRKDFRLTNVPFTWQISRDGATGHVDIKLTRRDTSELLIHTKVNQEIDFDTAYPLDFFLNEARQNIESVRYTT